MTITNHQQNDKYFLLGKFNIWHQQRKFEHKQNEDRTVKLHAGTIKNEYQTNQNYVYINCEVKHTFLHIRNAY